MTATYIYIKSHLATWWMQISMKCLLIEIKRDREEDAVHALVASSIYLAEISQIK